MLGSNLRYVLIHMGLHFGKEDCDIMYKIAKHPQVILDLLGECSFEAYVVGECVRDLIFGKEPLEWAICTNASISEVLKTCEMNEIKAEVCGDVITASVCDQLIVVNTYQVNASDSQSTYNFATTWEQNLSKREFTINAISLDMNGCIVDPLGGFNDLKAEKIRFVGSLLSEIDNEPICILKALRLASELGFDIERRTLQEIMLKKTLLQQVSKKKITNEFRKILAGRYAPFVLSKYRSVFVEFIPELIPMFQCAQNSRYHPYNVWDHTIAAITSTPEDEIIRLVMFFHDVGKPASKTFDEDGGIHFYEHEDVSERMTRVIMERMEFDKETIDIVAKMVGFHKLRPEATRESVKDLLKTIGSNNFDIFYYVRVGDNMGQSLVLIPERIRKISRIRCIAQEIIKNEYEELLVEASRMIEYQNAL